MAEVAALKDRLAASEQRAAVAEAKIEVMTQIGRVGRIASNFPETL